MFKKMLALLSITLMMAATALAHENEAGKGDTSTSAHYYEEHVGARDGNRAIPEQVTKEHWAYKEIAQLVQKYSSDRKLIEGHPCPRDQLAQCFLAVLVKVTEKYKNEGAQAIRKDDIEIIASLDLALEDDLDKLDGYRLRRETIKEILVLVEPEVPAFEYMIGVNGFLRGDVASNFSLRDSSLSPGHGEARFLYRMKPYAYWHPTDWLDIHAEGQGYGYKGSHQEFNRFSLYQGFVEAKLPGSEVLALKAGRQEFSYGGTFILGPDSFFDGLSFDAARLRIKPVDSLTIDLLAGVYATPFSGGVKGSLAGGYVTYTASKNSSIEAYALRDTGSQEHHPGEHLDSWGQRSTVKLGPVSLEFEPVYQSGKLFNFATGANDNINAYGGHIDLAGETKLGGFKNTIFLSYAVGSGDTHAANKEFRNPNNDNSLVGDMGVIGDLSGVDVGGHHASGLQIYTLGLGIDLTDKLNFSATARKFISNSVEDGFSRRLGLETDFTLTYTMNKDYSLILGFDRFFTGKFFRDASGSDKDINYGYAMLAFNFDKTKRKLPSTTASPSR